MKIKNALITLFIVFSFNCFSQNFEWAKSMEGITCCSEGLDITTDQAGSVFTIGKFRGTVDFDPGINIFNLTSNGSNEDVFIQKMDDNGNFMWAISFGGAQDDVGYSIATDNAGNVYSVGYFGSFTDFDPSSATFNLNSSMDDIFIQKLDNNGNFVWAKKVGGSYDDVARSIFIDSDDNLYITGKFYYQADMDPGPGVFNILPDPNCIDNVFILKLDSAGILIWAKAVGGYTGDIGNDITVDNDGNVYTVGKFGNNNNRPSTDFDPGPGIYSVTENGEGAAFILKLNSLGNFIWMKYLGGYLSSGAPDQSFGKTLVVDLSGNVYFAGYFHRMIDFDPGAGVNNIISSNHYVWSSLLSSNNSFIEKLDSSGNLVWVKTFGGNNNIEGNPIIESLSLDDNNNIYSTGWFAGTVDFDPGVDSLKLTETGYTSLNPKADIFINKLDSNGDFVWALSMGDVNYDISFSIMVHQNNSIYTTGSFFGITNPVDFDPGPGTFNISSNSRDAYVHKLGQITTMVINNNLKSDISIYPIPTSNQLIISINDLVINEIKIIEINGKLIKTFKQNTHTVDVSDLSSGVYFIKLITEERTITKKFVKQ